MRLKTKPDSLQLILELLVGGLHKFFADILGDKINRYFPWLATLFIYILALNWVSVLPGVGSVGIFRTENEKIAGTVLAAATENDGPVLAQAESEKNRLEFTPIFRPGTADLNTTLALALLTVGYIQIAGFSNLGLSYLKKFFNITNPINFVVGLLELVSEISRIISFAFRLFGNIFAGEVLLTVIAFLMPVLAPIPFLGLEIFVGFIQALVFSMLTAVFLQLAISHAEH